MSPIQVAGVSINSYVDSDGQTRIRINNWLRVDLNCLDMSWDQYQQLLGTLDVLDYE